MTVIKNQVTYVYDGPWMTERVGYGAAPPPDFKSIIKYDST